MVMFSRNARTRYHRMFLKLLPLPSGWLLNLSTLGFSHKVILRPCFLDEKDQNQNLALLLLQVLFDDFVVLNLDLP